MEFLLTMVVPLTISGVALYGAGRRVDVYAALIHGAGEGLETLLRIVPALVGLLTAVSMLRASGALDLAAQLLAPLLDRVGVPSELLPLMLVRPISGSAALGVGAELIGTCGPDSYLGRVAAVMLGSTETTFYTIAVYFGAVGVTRTRYALPAALCADLTGFLAAAWAVGAIRERSPIPLVADIHFDYRLALECVAAGCDKVRINPGNIGGEDRVKAVADACRQKGIPIRIGVNGGSLEKPILAKYGGVTPEALVESAFGHIRLLEKFDFTDICVSLKSSSVRTTMAAYRLMNQESDYPLHLGVTETGTLRMGTLKSAVGIGGLLAMGIGDTMRVSLSTDPVEEVYAARDILKAAGVRKEGPELVSCPTCGRTRIDLIGLATQVEERLKAVDKPITVAVMGCVVNGPGEASAADVGIAGGNGEGLLFRKGEIVKKVPQEALVDELFTLIEKL